MALMPGGPNVQYWNKLNTMDDPGTVAAIRKEAKEAADKVVERNAKLHPEGKPRRRLSLVKSIIETGSRLEAEEQAAKVKAELRVVVE